MAKQIPLTQGQVAIVDDWQYEELSRWNWRARWNKKTKSYYAVRSEGTNPRKEVQMHRVVARTPKGMLCDHRNHDTLDNQEHNLRNVTNSQNNMNARLRSDNKLGERNISKHYGGFIVRVYRDNKAVFRKTFGTLGEAIAARDVAIKEVHGEYAYLNDQENVLRKAANSDVGMNNRAQVNNVLRQKHIWPHGNGFRVRIVKDGQCVFGKTFRRLGDAIEARDAVIKQIHGDFACRNNS